MADTAYQPKFLRAGRTLSRKGAIQAIMNGRAVTVAVPDEDLAGMGDLRITVTAGNWNWSGGDARTGASLPATSMLAAGDLEVFAAVATAAASLMGDANTALLARDLADA